MYESIPLNVALSSVDNEEELLDVLVYITFKSIFEEYILSL